MARPRAGVTSIAFFLRLNKQRIDIACGIMKLNNNIIEQFVTDGVGEKISPLLPSYIRSAAVSPAMACGKHCVRSQHISNSTYMRCRRELWSSIGPYPANGIFATHISKMSEEKRSSTSLNRTCTSLAIVCPYDGGCLWQNSKNTFTRCRNSPI